MRRYVFHILRDALPGQRHPTIMLHATIDAPDPDTALKQYIDSLLKLLHGAPDAPQPPEQIELPIVTHD